MRTLSSRIRIRCTSCNFSRKPCRQLDQVCRSRWRLQALRNHSQFWKPIWPNLSKWIPQTRGLAQVRTELTFEAYCMSMRINPSPKRDVNNKHFLSDWGYITQGNNILVMLCCMSFLKWFLIDVWRWFQIWTQFSSTCSGFCAVWKSRFLQKRIDAYQYCYT